MEIEVAQAHLFMGCGITKDSVPEKSGRKLQQIGDDEENIRLQILDCRLTILDFSLF